SSAPGALKHPPPGGHGGLGAWAASAAAQSAGLPADDWGFGRRFFGWNPRTDFSPALAAAHGRGAPRGSLLGALGSVSWRPVEYGVDLSFLVVPRAPPPLSPAAVRSDFQL